MAILKAFFSELPCGAFAILATLLGFVLGLLSGVIVWLWKAYGIRHMLADEVELNWKAYEKFKDGEDWPVRSVYIWQSLQPLVPGLLSRSKVKALADFYYHQAEIYKDHKVNRPLTQQKAKALQDTAKKTLAMFGRVPSV